MPFESVEARPGRAHICGADSITVAIHSATKSPKAPKTVLAVRFGQAVVEKLGWSEQDPIHFGEGVGVDAGLLLLQRGRGPRLSLNGKNFLLRVPTAKLRHHVFPEYADQVVVEFKRFGGQVFVTLPDWASVLGMEQDPATAPAEAPSPQLPLAQPNG